MAKVPLPGSAPVDLPLSVLAAEFLPGGTAGDVPGAAGPLSPTSVAGLAGSADSNPDPLGLNNRPRRILRVSPLVAVAPFC